MTEGGSVETTEVVPVVAVVGLALVPSAFDLRVRLAGDDLDALAASVVLHVGADGAPKDLELSPPIVVGTFTIVAVYFWPLRDVTGGREIRFVMDDQEGFAHLIFVESTPSVPGHWVRDRPHLGGQ